MHARSIQSFLLLAALATPAAQIELPTVRGMVADTRGRRRVPLRPSHEDGSTCYADADGRYRFSGVDPEDDYTIHAEDDGLSSKSQTVSLSGHKWQRQLVLRIEKRNRQSEGGYASTRQSSDVIFNDAGNGKRI